MAAVIVMGAVVVLLAAGIAWMAAVTRRPQWRTSPVRMRALHLLAAIAPFFGGSVRPPEPAPPAAAAPGEPETGAHIGE